MKNILHRITNWEAWPFKLLYAPIAPVWLWYMLKSRSVWFFTPSNPKITFGGMDGEPKKEMYKLLPKNFYPATFNVLPQQDFEQALAGLQNSGIQYPFIVKPEVGCQGILFRKINTQTDFKNYHKKVPVEYIVQALVSYPMEVSVFYIRHPLQKKGMITGFLHKIPLQVIGNGTDTLEALVKQHPKGKKRVTELYNKHKDRWHLVLPANEKYMLSYAANHNRGAHFIDLKEHIDDKLLAIFDKLSFKVDDFFYGRYDIMCTNVEDLKNEKNFTILEYNGCGAEPNHFYDTGYTLIGAYKEILKHWKALYQICKYNSKQGIKPWPFKKGKLFIAHIKAHYKLIKQADALI
ncbi:MAG: hypothetical protein KF741_11095 [Ferruginibacter sp.]|nr:hypothetical protein [Bacteroidota bacterium]MBX2919778.1 hypothetical protein [Ferruginibacter sp.]MCB0709925.1 hypothetical protein [Chitinophagaceae bacterium]MCC7378898.1 hypothetical protein [Chitinophagaceae bacterium]